MTTWIRPLIVAVLAGASSLAASAALGRTLSARAARESHALPDAGRQWIDPAAVTPEMIQHGSTLFLNSCAHCHGADAHGDEGPDLHDLQVSDRYIGNMIIHGREGEMPSFAKKHNREEIGAIIAYLRTLK
ncbi:MAG TPA: cytochrome c [Candidatus Didemnitutus sp.]|nr:cytochrome c [Candidatus Didemnitutus sp.]